MGEVTEQLAAAELDSSIKPDPSVHEDQALVERCPYCKPKLQLEMQQRKLDEYKRTRQEQEAKYQQYAQLALLNRKLQAESLLNRHMGRKK